MNGFYYIIFNLTYKGGDDAHNSYYASQDLCKEYILFYYLYYVYYCKHYNNYIHSYNKELVIKLSMHLKEMPPKDANTILKTPRNKTQSVVEQKNDNTLKPLVKHVRDPVSLLTL